MSIIQLKDKQFEVFLKESFILEGIKRVAEQLNEDFHDKTPLFLVVLNGAFMFASDLIGKFNFPCEVTFLRLKSYEGLSRVEKLKEVQGLIEDVTNRHIIIVEDIIDTGHTMARLLDNLKEKNPASIKIATLLFKPEALQLDVTPDYTVLEIPNEFIVGYGLDYDGLGRNLRDIYKIKE
jgi:hypoxanthine phosphoribosyltransferase